MAVKSRLAYVPDHVAFYPWMTVRATLEYRAAFRKHWNRDTERTVLVAAGFVAAALGAGLANHRSAERGARRLWKQGCWILGGVFVGAAVLALCVTLAAGRIG